MESRRALEQLPRARGYSIEFDRENEFIGGRVETIGFLLNRARKQNPAPLQVSVIHQGVSLADHRLSELKRKVTLSGEEEQEYRHLFRVKDFLVDNAIPQLERAIDLVVNDDRLRRDTYLESDEELSQFLMGLRNAVFGAGTPMFWGSADYPWYSEWASRPHNWNVWWREDQSLCVTIRVSEEEAEWIRKKYRFVSRREVFPKETAFDLYALTIKTFYEIALPKVVLALVTRWPSRSSIPEAALDLYQWVFSPAAPEDSWIVPPVGSSEFHELRDSLT